MAKGKPSKGTKKDKRLTENVKALHLKKSGKKK